MYEYIFKHPYRIIYIIIILFKQTYRNVVFRVYILTLALYTVQCTLYIREFKHMWYQIYIPDYCLKHFKLVFF